MNKKGKITLMGARKFLDMPKGTIYHQFWMDNSKECLKLIEEFNKNPKEYFSNLGLILHIYGNNRGSMALRGPVDDDSYEPIETDSIEDYLFYYDANVVGDASPNDTLYLVIEESLLPDIIEFEYGSVTKDEFLQLRNIFLEFDDFKEHGIDNIEDPANEWARDELYNDDYYKNNPLLDTDITVTIELDQ